MKNTFSKIAVFQYSSEAQIMKARLEAEGIEVFLYDQFTIDTDPLVSNAIGGVKLKVWQEDEIKARKILDSISPYAVDDDGDAVECPICGNNEVSLVSTIKDIKTLIAFLFSFLTTSLPIATAHQYKCEHCKQQFNLD